MTAAWVKQKLDAIEEQIRFWKEDGWKPIDAWMALGGSGVVFNVDWDSVRQLQRRFYKITEVIPAAGESNKSAGGKALGGGWKNPKVDKVKRGCLRCGEGFWSTGANNRICDPCKASDEFY